MKNILRRGDPGHAEMIQVLRKVARLIEVEEDNMILLLIQINTLQKVKALDEWIEENTVDGKPTFNEIQLMNRTAEIGRMDQ